ncbi:hypothetical protein VNO77_04406 [Canavalia gladiata]|uniref:Uncharacterized protein n=1 Tax=Canavalia gladiata TaxID=3824 RepID=A0AAN9MXA1_CANGL
MIQFCMSRFSFPGLLIFGISTLLEMLLVCFTERTIDFVARKDKFLNILVAWLVWTHYTGQIGIFLLRTFRETKAELKMLRFPSILTKWGNL